MTAQLHHNSTARVFLACLLFFMSFSLAQETNTTENTEATSTTEPTELTPEQISDQALADWLVQERPELGALAALGAEEVCQQLPAFLTAPPTDLEVNSESRKELELDEIPEGLSVRRFSYPASQPGDIVGMVRVTLTQEEGQEWESQVQYLPDLGTDPMREFVTSRLGSFLFTIFSVIVLYLSFSKSFFRRWLTEGISYIKEHRRTTIFAIVSMYGLFALGYAVGGTLPQTCGDFMTGLIAQSIEQLGVSDAARSGDILGLSAAIFYQNFTFGAFLTTFIPALIFGIPAFLFNGSRFFTLALIFGFQGLGGFVNIILALILLIVELMAYILITAGGGMLLMTLIRKGFKEFRLAVRKVWMMLPIAMFLLIVGAWYESIIIILPSLLAGGP